MQIHVLISERTLSGGEELADDLQALGRGVVVGRRSGGGAHPVEVVRLTDELEVTVPVARSVNAVTGTNGDQEGVVPDIDCDPGAALERVRHLRTCSGPHGWEAAGVTSERTRIRRLPEKATQDVGALHEVLDAALVAHVGVVDPAGHPVVIPMACARDGDRLLLHGSTGSRLTAVLAGGATACVTVTLLDGLVYARSAFESSMHYRSAVVFGVLTRVPPERSEAALEVLTDHLLPGRWAEVRAPHRKELAATAVLALPLEEWSVKASDGPPDDPDGDLDAPVWAGVLPLHTVAGVPVDAPDLRGTPAVPEHVLRHPLTLRP